jgi:hypothetical protein
MNNPTSPIRAPESSSSDQVQQAAPPASAWPPDVKAIRERMAVEYHKATDGTGEGEYGCNGLTCPGVQRLIGFLERYHAAAQQAAWPLFRALVEQWRADAQQWRTQERDAVAANHERRAERCHERAQTLESCATRLEAALLASAPPASPWQPIETAPKGYDGKRFNYILFWGTSAGRSFNHPVVVCGYMDSERKPVQFYQYKLHITHWMPVPAPPASQEQP